MFLRHVQSTFVNFADISFLVVFAAFYLNLHNRTLFNVETSLEQIVIMSTALERIHCTLYIILSRFT